MIRVLSSLTPAPDLPPTARYEITSPNSPLAVDPNAYRFYTVRYLTMPLTLTLADGPANRTLSFTLAVKQVGTQQTVTLGGTNIKSSGGLLSSGKTLPSSGLLTADEFDFLWNGSNWECVDQRFDVK